MDHFRELAQALYSMNDKYPLLLEFLISWPFKLEIGYCTYGEDVQDVQGNHTYKSIQYSPVFSNGGNEFSFTITTSGTQVWLKEPYFKIENKILDITANNFEIEGEEDASNFSNSAYLRCAQAGGLEFRGLEEDYDKGPPDLVPPSYVLINSFEEISRKDAKNFLKRQCFTRYKKIIGDEPKNSLGSSCWVRDNILIRLPSNKKNIFGICEILHAGSTDRVRYNFNVELNWASLTHGLHLAEKIDASLTQHKKSPLYHPLERMFIENQIDILPSAEFFWSRGLHGGLLIYAPFEGQGMVYYRNDTILSEPFDLNPESFKDAVSKLKESALKMFEYQLNAYAIKHKKSPQEIISLYAKNEVPIELNFHLK